MINSYKKILVTGSAGFIGFHLSSLLLERGHRVIGFDGMTDYYDVSLKERRHEILREKDGFSCHIGMLEDYENLLKIFEKEAPDIVVHLAAQAGVRYSLENPRAYIESNLVGTFNIMECAREFTVQHLLMASTSSVYGANTLMPFKEDMQTETPLTLYAATKKANESMAHSYSHLWKIPTTMFRFFTVYGPWGRPDMALFKFTKGIIEETQIDIYNHGNMFRDFTYVEDLVKGISLLIDRVPGDSRVNQYDNLSAVAPYRVVNIGNSQKVKLLDFIDEIENILGKKAIRNYMGMQKGDVPETWSDATLLRSLTGYQPETDFKEGIKRFVSWYRDFYNV
jgi:UDP-glucuronate 4-epimerase